MDKRARVGGIFLVVLLDAKRNKNKIRWKIIDKKK